MSSLPPGHDGVPPSRPADVSASVASASSSSLTAAASTSASSPPVAASAASSAAPSATASLPAASASASRASSSGGSHPPPAPFAAPAPHVPRATHNPDAMAVDAAAPAPALPVGTAHDPDLWSQDLYEPHFPTRLPGEFISYPPAAWDVISALLRPSGVAPGPVARSPSPLALPASDNPARFVGLADALHADPSDADAFCRVGEVVRMPGSPYGDHPIARGIIVGHNFMSPVYGRSESNTLDFLLPFPEYRFYHVLTYIVGPGGALTAHLVEWVPQSSLDFDAEATNLLRDPPTITTARPFHPSPPVPDRSVSGSRVDGMDGPPDDWSRTMAEAQTMSGIFVGYSDRVDGALFYCPHTKQTYETADYKLAPSLPTGAFFHLPYDGGLFFGLYDSPLTTPEPFPPGMSVSYLAPSASAPVPAHVISVPLSPTASGRPVVDSSPSYRLRLSDGTFVDAAADALSPREADPPPSPSSPASVTSPTTSRKSRNVMLHLLPLGTHTCVL